ncbi:MAG: hypothetical protein LQ343_007796 [Gyalolechia ehrenbergii]|nr:MAG: hypothetical protein LQ343_007796 [Gyalolechia ehrenbergii]
MSLVHNPPGSLLYQNVDATVTLLDIPHSIAEAQGTPDNPCGDMLYSLPPLENPFPSIEPNSQKAAKQKVRENLNRGSLSKPTFPQDLLAQGLADVRAAHAGAFCLQRKFADRVKSRISQPKKRTIEEVDTVEGSADKGFVLGPIFKPRKPLLLSCSATSNGPEPVHMADVVDCVVRNPHDKSVQLLLLETAQEYIIPPLSNFLLSTVGTREAALFSSAAYKLLPEPSVSAAPGQFDFILLDPPWDNRSVRRSKSYETQRKAKDDPMDILQGVLMKHIAPGGLVACWITNKQSVRDSALQAFEAWGLELVEEWAWLKTTVSGDPICAIDGIIRRPYEILLLGRSINPAIDGAGSSDFQEPTKKRLLIGVPDIHSRKPCLKQLIKPMIANRSNYRALEIFARNLTAGWWSWGDEVLKYNWEAYWAKAEPLNTT